jgi:hypothetical protein
MLHVKQRIFRKIVTLSDEKEPTAEILPEANAFLSTLSPNDVCNVQTECLVCGQYNSWLYYYTVVTYVTEE